MMMTGHFQMERAARYAYIVTTIGVGRVIHEYKQEYSKWDGEPCTVGITDTGVAIVRTHEGVIVTMYILTITEANRYFNNAVPMVLAAVIRTNMKRGHVSRQNMGEA